MRHTEKTARKDARTAGKTATKNTNTAKGAVWRTVATKRGTALRSPDGRLYYGTAQEVRDAALMPWRRKMLADGLRFIRSYAEGHETSREELAEWATGRHCCNSERRCEMTEKRLIGECIARGKDDCCCYIYDKEICGKPCSGQNKNCKHFFRVARWRNAK